jgi:nucleoside-diphosphate-sugar epimerase
MSTCVIFGGAGFIGTHLGRRFLLGGRFDEIHLADLRPVPDLGDPRVSSSVTDVRKEIPEQLTKKPPEWIFNFAAIHREPGHEEWEYFDTNLKGAEQVCRYAGRVGCRSVYFTSSISVYGPTVGPTSEQAAIRPISPYGGSKYPAEWIHRAWLAGASDRRLIISRPGVVYGPGDPGNVLRMIRAVQRGYFVFPGSTDLRKSYAYIFGLLDSIEFTMAQSDPLIIYNYVESPTEPLGQIVREVKQFMHSRAPVLSLPLWALMPVATVLYATAGSRSPVHPVRVRKAATSTHIVPAWLEQRGFEFRYPFRESLRHWRDLAPGDFAS